MGSHATLAGRLGLFAFGIFVSTGMCGKAVWGQYSLPSPPPADLKAGYDSMTIEQAQEWLGILAGPVFEGRGTGQPGYAKAAHWVAGKLAEFGLEPIGNNGTYFQMLPMKRRMPLLKECFISGPNGLKIDAVGNIGFEQYSDDQELTGPVVFINFTGPNTELPQGTQLRDKVVFYFADASASRSAAMRIARLRPLGAIRVIKDNPKSITQLVREGVPNRTAGISGTIKVDAAKVLIRGLGGKPRWINPADKPGVAIYQPVRFELEDLNQPQEITIRMRYREEQAAVPNVVAWLEGSDPNLKNEYVVLGSHLDHLGIRGGQVYPGADDNGSGSTAVLSIAKAFSMNPVRPKRSVLFIWFAAEEIGLVGSKHYCDNPTKPLEDMICMFNIDMVGRNEETKDETSEENEGSIHLVGSQKGETDIHDIVLKANESVGFRFELDEEDVWNRSDQINFYQKGVPVSFLFGGFHPDYHRPSDKVGDINFKKLVSAARLYYLAVNLASDHGPFEMKYQSRR